MAERDEKSERVNKISYSRDSCYDVAYGFVRDERYIDALKVLNRNAETNGNDCGTYILYGYIYTRLGLFSESMNKLFLALDLSECYEDDVKCLINLAYDGFMMFDRGLADYYMNMLDDDVQPDEMYDDMYGIMCNFRSLDFDGLRDAIEQDLSNDFKVVWPVQEANYNDAMMAGFDCMQSGDWDGAIKEFKKVPIYNKSFQMARQNMVSCEISAGRWDDAFDDCCGLLKEYPDDMKAMGSLMHICAHDGNKELALATALKMEDACGNTRAEVESTAKALGDVGMDDRAFPFYMRLIDEFKCYDKNMIYFCAVSAYNCGRFDESLKKLSLLKTVYPGSAVADEAMETVRKTAKRREKKPKCDYDEMDYDYDIEMGKKVEYLFKMTTAKGGLKNVSLKNLDGEVLTENSEQIVNTSISDAVNWVLDACQNSADEYDERMQRIAYGVAPDVLGEEKTRELLLNVYAKDDLKNGLLVKLGKKNVGAEFNVTLMGMYHKVVYQKLALGKSKRKIFVEAYDGLVARFSLCDDNVSKTYAMAAEGLYKKLQSEGRLDDLDDSGALAMAIHLYSGQTFDTIKNRDVASIFSTTIKKGKEIVESK